VPPVGGADEAPPNSFATAALAAGIVGILVLPGLILGFLGLWRARTAGTGRRPSWLGIALSLAWAAGIIVLVWPGPGTAADPGCARYQADGRAAVARLTAALRSDSPPGRLRADLGRAARAVNDATASAQNISVRNSLAALSGDLQTALAASSAGRIAPAALDTTLTRRASAAAQLCPAPR
jgi:hypothetical protein